MRLCICDIAFRVLFYVEKTSLLFSFLIYELSAVVTKYRINTY